MFRFKTREEYERELLLKCSKGDETLTEEYNDLLDEYVEFCEVSGSAK